MNITLTVAIATCQPELLYRSLRAAARLIHGTVDLVVFGNGCQIDPLGIPAPFCLVGADWVPANIGVPRAMDQLWRMARIAQGRLPPEQHVVAYVHDDLFMREDGWNARIASTFANDDGVMLAGIVGAPGLGRDEIYRDPYEFWHLSRCIATWSNLANAEVHGERITDEREVVFVDGVAMFVRGSLLEKVNGWAWWPEQFVHHTYDYGLSCMVRRHGGRVRVIPLAAFHGVSEVPWAEGMIIPEENGGGHSGTYGSPFYTDLADKLGGDTAVHRGGHRWVYDEFRDVLPLRL